MAKKDFGRRLMPEYLLKYAEELNKNHPDPSASWGGGGGGDYTAGEGIEISDQDVISIDEEVVAKKTDIPNLNQYAKKSDFTQDIDNHTVTVGSEYYHTEFGHQTIKIQNGRYDNPKQITIPYAGGTMAMTSDIITSYNDLNDKPTIPTKTSDLNNDSGFITSSALSGYATETWVENKGYSTFSGSYNDLTDKPTIPTKTSDLNNDSGFITGVSWSDVTDKPTFATVATSGDYDDLLNKPTIPTVDYPVTDVQVDGVSVVSNKVASITMPTVPTKVSDLDNDSGFITSSALSGYATETWVGQQGYLTSVSWADVSGKPTFATVATTGDYDDLLNKPTIPTVNCNVIQITRTYSEGSWTENWPDQATTALIKANPERYAFIVKTVNEDTIEVFFSPLLTATLEDPGSPIYYRWGANVAGSSNITTCTVTVNIYNQWWYSETTSSYSPYTAGTGISISSGSIGVDTTTVALKTDIPTIPVTDVQVNGTSVLSGTVASVSVPTSASSTSTSTSTSSVTPTTETLVFTLDDDSTVTVNVMTGATVSTTTTTTTTTTLS